MQKRGNVGTCFDEPNKRKKMEPNVCDRVGISQFRCGPVGRQRCESGNSLTFVCLLIVCAFCVNIVW